MNDHSNEETDFVSGAFKDLHLEAPPNTLDRFRRRASLFKESRFVLERQFYGFWIVLNTFLRLLFKHVSMPVAAPGRDQANLYRRAVQDSKEGRP